MKNPPLEFEKAVINGRVQFGSWAYPLKSVNLLDSARPLGYDFPKGINRMRLKEWEAFQIISDQYFILGAMYQTRWMAFNIMTVWDIRNGTLETWQSYGNPFKLVLEDQILDSVNHYRAGPFDMRIENQLKSGCCKIEGKKHQKHSRASSTEKNELEFEFNLTSCSEPSVVLMPLGKNRALYTHKEFFGVQGKLVIRNQICDLGNDVFAIIDDHKGFYPYQMHYDWVTGFEKTDEAGWKGFNLTKNQVLDPDKYNENRLWVNGKIISLPTVSFTHLPDGTWRIQDEKGQVDLCFTPSQHLKFEKHFGLIDVNYHAPFGYFSGTITDSEGVTHLFLKACGMGEDKTYRL